MQVRLEDSVAATDAEHILADNSVSIIRGSVKLKLRLGLLCATVTNGFGAVLAQHRCCQICHDGSTLVMFCECPCITSSASQFSVLPHTPKQRKQSMLQTDKCCLCLGASASMNPLFPGAGPSGRSSSSNAAGAAGKATTQPGSPKRYPQSRTNTSHHSETGTCHNTTRIRLRTSPALTFH